MVRMRLTAAEPLRERKGTNAGGGSTFALVPVQARISSCGLLAGNDLDCLASCFPAAFRLGNILPIPVNSAALLLQQQAIQIGKNRLDGHHFCQTNGLDLFLFSRFPASFHSIRNTFTLRLIWRGLSPRPSAKILGHSSSGHGAHAIHKLAHIGVFHGGILNGNWMIFLRESAPRRW